MFLLVMLPYNFPMLLGMSGLHDELFAREFECARQIFADEGSYQSALYVEDEGVSAFVDLEGAKGRLVAALRILLRPSRGLGCGLLSMTWTDMWPSRVKTSKPVESAR